MNRGTKYFLFSILFLFPLAALAQPVKMQYRNRLGDSVVLVNTELKQKPAKKPPILTRGLAGGFRLNSDGWDVFMDLSVLYGNEDFGAINRNKIFKEKVFEFSLGEVYNLKEIKSGAFFPGMAFQPGTYKLGKINNFYRVNFGYGYRHLIAGKPDEDAVSIHWLYMGGLSAGLIKPYYLDLLNQGEQRYTPDNEQDFLNPGEILGKGGFTKGWNHLKFVPGLFLRTGLHFDFAPRKKGIIGVDVGAAGYIYTSAIQEMVRVKPRRTFMNLYASIQFGGKW